MDRRSSAQAQGLTGSRISLWADRWPPDGRTLDLRRLAGPGYGARAGSVLEVAWSWRSEAPSVAMTWPAVREPANVRPRSPSWTGMCSRPSSVWSGCRPGRSRYDNLKAAVDRLLYHAHVIVTEGTSMRLSEATSGRGVVPLTSNHQGDQLSADKEINRPPTGRSPVRPQGGAAVP